MPLWCAFFFVYYTVGMFYLTSIADTSLINAQAVGGVWEESYTSIRTETICDSKDDKGNCTSSHTKTHCDNHHPDLYEITFSDGSTHSIREGNFTNLVQQFKNRKEVSVLHIGQCSVGDGRKFVTEFKAGESAELYVSYEIPVVNYILANSNLYNTSKEVAQPYIKYFQTVPGIMEHPAGIGPWRSNRLITSSVTVPENWRISVENDLNRMNGVIGPTKEINAILYVVGVKNRDFATALEAYWTHGKKNQLTIIIGSEQFPKIEWVDVIDFWSQNPDVRIDLRDRLQATSLDDPKLVSIIEEEVRKKWQRRHMASFEYLAWDISLPWWSYILLTLFSMALAVFFSKTLKNVFQSY